MRNPVQPLEYETDLLLLNFWHEITMLSWQRSLHSLSSQEHNFRGTVRFLIKPLNFSQTRQLTILDIEVWLKCPIIGIS